MQRVNWSQDIDYHSVVPSTPSSSKIEIRHFTIVEYNRYWYIQIHGSVNWTCQPCHYNDVIMTTVASQITSLTVVYSTVYSDADQRKHKSSASLAFLWGIHRDRWIPRTKGQLHGKCFHLMTSSCGIKGLARASPTTVLSMISMA